MIFPVQSPQGAKLNIQNVRRICVKRRKAKGIFFLKQAEGKESGKKIEIKCFK